MTRSRTLFAVLVVALLATMAAPAGARTRDPRAARDAARAKRAQLAAKLNTIKASEARLIAAAHELNRAVSAQAAQVDAARRAFAVADREVAESTAALARTKASIDKLGKLAVERAVASYMTPHRDDLDELDPTDLGKSARKAVLLSSVAANDVDVLDQLNAAREDYAVEMQAAQAARDRARARKADTESRLAALHQTQSAQARLAAAVLARKREVLGEIDEQSKAEAELTRIIRQRGSTGGTSIRSSRGCIWPVHGHVTSEFGRRWGRLHAGIDIGAPRGTPIWAAKSGTVIFAGQQRGYGNVIIIDHGGGMSTLYGHQSRLGARDGQSVHQGQVIGYVGSTGHSTGNHVHFETRYGGTPRNPRGCLS